ncbi:MAG: vWA domain-containing protein, partial [Candidatus Kapaibacterium sp.]
MIKYIIAAILLLSVTVAYSQTALHVSGMIVSAVDGKPVNKAVVLLEGSIHYSYVNNDEGRFHLYLDGMNDTVRFTAKGYETKKLFVNNDSLDMIVVLNEKVEPEVNDEIEVGQGSVTIASGLSGKKSEGVYGASRVEPPMRTSLKFETLTSSDAVKSSDGAEMKTGFLGDTPLKQQAESGLLTAGEVNDFAKWKMWNDLTENELSLYKDNWNLYPLDRFTVQIENELYLPVYGAKVNLLENDFVVWSSMSDNTGKAELWYNPFTNRSQSGSNLRIEIEYSGKFYNIVKAKRFSEGVNFLRINSLCLKPELTEIAFVVDATGSMGDEINYLKMDLQAIMKEIGDTLPGMKFNLGSVFYRDSSDMYLTRSSDLNADLQKTSDFIEEQNAEGGGDYPEAVHRGLDIAINQLNWSENAMTKLIFLVLDAPPHDEPEVIEELQAFVVKASQKGIRIIPIACSGINKNTEYFLRSIALLTNGTYTFLTDDSGIGNPHIKPSTDK